MTRCTRFTNPPGPWLMTVIQPSPTGVALFALACFMGAELGSALAFQPGSMTAVWPPAGLLLAALIANPVATWPRFLAASLGAGLASDVGFHGSPLAASLALGLAHALEACAGAWMLRRFVGVPFRCSTPTEALALVSLGGLVSTALGATLGAAVRTALLPGGSYSYSYWSAWRGGWCSDELGVLLVAPLLLIGTETEVEAPAGRGRRFARSAERIVALTTLLAIGQSIFSRAVPPRDPVWQFPYLAMVPFLFWIGLRSAPRSGAIAASMLTLLVVWHTKQGHGPAHWIGRTTPERALLIQALLTAVFLTALLVAAIASGRRLAERRLRASEERSRRAALFQQAILDAAHYSIISTDPNGLIRTFNAAAERWLGYPAAEVVGRRTPVFIHDAREVATRAEQLTRELEVAVEPGFDVFVARARRGEHDEHEWTYIRRDGSRFPVRLSITALRDQDGRITGFLGIAKNITEQKAAEDALHRAHDELETRVEERTADLARANALLRDEEKRFRQLADSMPQIVWTARPDGYLDYFNERWYEFTGSTRGDGGDRSWLPILHPDDVQPCLDSWYRAVRGEEPYEIEYRFQDRTTGRYRWHLGRALPVRDEAGRVVRWYGTCTDIDDRKRVEEALRESEARQSRALSAARIGHWEWNVRTQELTYQDSLPILYGRPAGQPFATSSEFLEIVHPEDRSSVLAATERALTPGVPYEAEFRVLWPDGSTHWLSGRGGAFFDEAGEAVRMVGVNLDITERKDAEAQIRRLNETLERRVAERTAELRQSEERFRGAFDAAAIGMALLAPDGRWLQVNRSLCRIVGYSEAELLERTFQDLTHPGDLEAELERTRRLLAGEISSYQLEKRYLHKNGHVVWIVLSGSLVRDQNGRPLHLVAQIEDITTRKQFEEELRRARDQAMAAMRAKGEFLATMSHEIRTPMNGVMGMAELLLGTPLNDLQRDYAEIIHSSGEALLTVINDILDLSKIEAGKMTLAPIPFDLRTTLEDVADLLAPRAHQKGLLIASRVDPDIPAGLVGDPVRIRQVLTNLVGNAVKFTDRGEVSLEARLVARTPAGATLRVLVRDTGIGIPEGRQADIFESFTQVEGVHGLKQAGTGLGLTICRRLMDLMGGRIGLESTPGVGCTFWFELTLEEPAQTQPVDGPVPTGLDGLRVLIVDDHPTNRRILREALLARQCRPEEAGSGAEALAKLGAAPEEDPYALVLLDQDMPGMDGRQAASAIKAAPRFADVPLVRMTSLGSPRASEPPEPGLFFATLTKPVRRDPLGRLLGRIASAPPTTAPPPLPAPEESPLPAPLRVLLVEDNEINRKVAAGMVEWLGCHAVAVPNGREAVDAVDCGGYDLVLMDIQMPEMDGFAATAAIRGQESASGWHIPIIAMTAHAMQGDRERCLEAGMDGYLTKPVRLGPLREALATWGLSHQRPDAPAAAPATPTDRRRAFDLEQIRRSCGGDASFAREILGMLLQSIPDRLGRIETAAAAGDSRYIAWEAHGIKGIFLTVGSETLAASFQELVPLAERDDIPAVQTTLLAIRDQWDRFQDGASRYLDGLALPPAVLHEVG